MVKQNREKWLVRNMTSTNIGIGGIPGMKTVRRNGGQIDLLKYATKQEISQSQSLKKLFNNNSLKLIKEKDGVSTSFLGTNASAAILSAEENEIPSSSSSSYTTTETDALLENLTNTSIITDDITSASIITDDIDISAGNEKWEDLRFPATALKGGATRLPDWALLRKNAGNTSQGVFSYWFDDGSEEELYLAVQMPHSWKEGSDIHLHVHWTPEADEAGSKKVSWGIEYTWANIGDLFPVTSLMYGNIHIPADTTLLQHKHYLTELGVLVGTGKTLSSMLMMRLFRDAGGAGETDDYGSDAGLLEFDIHYQIDAFGSDQEYIK